MDFRNLLTLIWRKLWLIIPVAILSGAAAYWGMSQSGAIPRYSATTIVAIGGDIYGETPDSDYFDLADTMLSSMLQLSKLNIVTSEVVRNLGLAESPEMLADMLDISQIEGTNLLSIRAIHRNPSTAAAIANEVANQIRRLSPSRWRNFVLVAESAQRPTSPDPTVLLPVILTSFTAALLLLSIIFFQEYFRRPFYDERDVNEMLGLRTLLTLKPIPFIWQRCIRGKLLGGSEPVVWWSLKEACRQLLNNSEDDTGQKSIMVLCPDSSVSHAVVAGNLAAAWASEGQKTLLADVDLKRADATRLVFKTPLNDGFASLVNQLDIDPSKLLQAVPKQQGLWMLGSKAGQQQMQVSQLRKALDGLWTMVDLSSITIISGPPAATSVETLMAASRATLVLLVLDVRHTRYQQAVENVALLEANDVLVDGVILADLGTRTAAFSIAWQIAPYLRRLFPPYRRAKKAVGSSYQVDPQA